MTIRLHPATPHGGRLHRLAEPSLVANALMRVRRWEPSRIDRTACGVWFAWGTWKGEWKPLPKCGECWV